ncbi:MAG: hypothetical protein JJW01_02910 [Alphaproteobacteria bacterium]|nr:hypothetical protein [Rickettsiales bacterium]
MSENNVSSAPKKEEKNFKGFDLSKLKLPFGSDKILRVLPQRWPLLLIDRVEEVCMDYVVAIKATTIAEHSLMGHFEGYPVTPGVVMIESCAQACTLLAYFRDHHPLDRSKVKVGVRMVSLDKVKLRSEVLPGDVLRVKASHVSTKRTKDNIFHRFSCVGKVGDRVSIEAQMTGYFFNDISSDSIEI